LCCCHFLLAALLFAIVRSTVATYAAALFFDIPFFLATAAFAFPNVLYFLLPSFIGVLVSPLSLPLLSF
jgi:hypothetical protein